MKCALILMAIFCLFISGCGYSDTRFREVAESVCREYKENYFGEERKGKYVAYKSEVDYWTCYDKNGKGLTIFEGDFIRAKVYAND